MDQDKFDALVQKLTVDGTRRGVVRGALTGAVGAALAAAGLQAADAKNGGKGKNKRGQKGAGVSAERCVVTGRPCGNCGKKKNGEPRCKPCDQCCTRNSIASPNGRKRCACKVNSAPCGNDSQCCSGSCNGGTCGAYAYGVG